MFFDLSIEKIKILNHIIRRAGKLKRYPEIQDIFFLKVLIMTMIYYIIKTKK